MEPDKFRESRQAINRLCKGIDLLIEQKELEASTEGHIEVSSRLDILKPQAEGEIQERSVKNLGIKLKGLSTLIAKLKPKKKPAIKKEPKIAIVWDEERLGQLSTAFLGKVFKNMGDDKNTMVCFGTTGKGIRPSYQIEFGNQETKAFTGSGHKPQAKTILPGTKKKSQPFSHEVIDSILHGK
ncbi:MAG: hypothetical protein PF503_24785 [Desulfobacula sp.]|nr:hypothetical protein [Desulfobacula sp.]